MLHSNLKVGPNERGNATKPFIDDHAKRILITGHAWFASKLLGSHVRGSSQDGACLGLPGAAVQFFRQSEVGDLGDKRRLRLSGACVRLR